MYIINTLLPVFLLVVLGAALRRWGFISAASQDSYNRLSYWVALPALLFSEVAGAPPGSGAAWDVARIVIGATLAVTALAAGLAFATRMPVERIGTFVQSSFRGNLAFVGLPVIVFAFAHRPDASRIEGAAALALGPVIALYNVMSVVALLLSQHRLDRKAWRPLLRAVVTNPLLIACLAGWFWNVYAAQGHGIMMPLFLRRSLSTIAAAALPLSLMCIGGTLASVPLRHTAGVTLLSVALKTLAAPLIGILIARLAGATPSVTALAAILLATPTAAASYILTEQLNGDTGLAAGTIVLSTVTSAASLAAVVGVYGH